MNLITRMRALVSDDAGQDLLEYALLVGLIALVAVAAVALTGENVNKIFVKVKDELAKAPTGSGTTP
jgi:Flp pilus assembly pilin Flp